MNKFHWFCVTMAVVGVGSAMSAGHLNRGAKDTPQSITCDQLAAFGPGDNAHVELTDFRLCIDAYVYRRKLTGWKGVWVPAVAKTAADAWEQETEAGGAPKVPRVIVKLPKAKNGRDVARAAEQATIRGVIVNRVESLGGEEKRLLSEKYPGIDFDRCWILQSGRRPAGSGGVLILLGFAAVAGLVGLWPVLRPLWRDEVTLREAASHMAHSYRHIDVPD